MKTIRVLIAAVLLALPFTSSQCGEPPAISKPIPPARQMVKQSGLRFEVFPRATLSGRQWYFRLRSMNAEVIAQSEGYKNKNDCLRAIWLVKQAGDAPIEVRN